MYRTVLMAIATALGAAPALAQQPELPTRALTAGVHLITAEVAADEPSRETGLMFRTGLKPNHGMLFVFEQPIEACMWMRNTLIPLAVAFLDREGRIVNVEEMRPRTENVHCARRAVPYALEMASGWFSERGLKAGEAVIGGLPKRSEAAAK